MYKDHPTGDLSLEEFEKFALDRLRSKPLRCWHVSVTCIRRGALLHNRHLHAPLPNLGWAARLLFGLSMRKCDFDRTHFTKHPFWTMLTCAVLKAIEEAKLRSKPDQTIQVSTRILPVNSCAQLTGMYTASICQFLCHVWVPWLPCSLQASVVLARATCIQVAAC